MSEFDKMFNVNVKGVFHGMKHAARIMIPQKKGSIISMSSISSEMGHLGPHPYTGSKHAMWGLTKNIATVGGVHPRPVKNNDDGTIDIDLIEDDYSHNGANESGVVVMNVNVIFLGHVTFLFAWLATWKSASSATDSRDLLFGLKEVEFTIGFGLSKMTGIVVFRLNVVVVVDGAVPEINWLPMLLHVTKKYVNKL
ncbi:Short-chain dehydrogenase/reductase SDR [Sesbania bispinosa]|nr:Short-chain dehydrogenase/reductase SDR [Sesbania bispinosa]